MGKITLTDVQTGYRVTSVINDNNATIEEAFDNTISRDGSTPNAMEAPLDMGGHKVLNVTPGTAASDAVTKAQLDSLGQNLPQTVIDQIATRVAEIINEGGGVVTPPGGYTNPPAPTAVTTSGVTASNVTLTWTMSDTTWAEGYYIYRNGALLATVRLGATLTYNDTTVAPLTTYAYTVASYNETYDYESARTAATPVTTPADASLAVPGTPTSVVATETVPGTVTITWAYNSTVNVQGFGIYRNGSFYDANSPANARSYVDTVPGPAGTINSYQVVGINPNGLGSLSTASNSVTITAPAVVEPPAPTGITAVASGSTSLAVAWTYSSNLHDGFIVDVIGPTSYFSSGILNKAARSYAVPGLTPSTTYSVAVSSVKNVGGVDLVYPGTSTTGTTAAGTVYTAPTYSPSSPTSFSGTAGTSFASELPVVAEGGSGTYTYTASNLPTGITLSSTGAWGGIPTEVVNGRVVTLTMNDTLTGLSGTTTISITIIPAQLTISTASGWDLGEIVALTEGVAANQTWTVSGGVGPYVWIWGGLPEGMAFGSATTTATVTGVPTQEYPQQFSSYVGVSDSLGAYTYVDFTLNYSATTVTNNVPVIAPITTTTAVVGTTYATIADVGAATTDADLNSGLPDPPTGITYALESITDKNGTIVTIGSLGLSFNTTTGVLSGTYGTGDDTGAPYTFLVSADDGVTSTLQASCNLPTAYTVGVSAIPSGKGIVATGGNTPYVYSLNAGSTIPTWLGNAVNSSTGVISGATGPIVAGTYTFTLKVVDDDATTVLVPVTVVASAVVTSDLATRAVGTLFASDFKNVYVNGVLVPSREITALGSNGSGAGNMLGEFYASNNSAAVDWVDDPTGYGEKCLALQMRTTTGNTSASVTHYISGGITASASSGGTVYSKCYAQLRFFGHREIYAFKDIFNDDHDRKLMYFGRGFFTGETVVTYSDGGFFRMQVDSDNSQQASLWGALGNGSYDPHAIPIPNPWGSSTSSGRPVSQSGQWAPYTVGTPPVSADGKLAYYTYYGWITGSSSGIYSDFPSLGNTGVDSNGIETPWLDQRVHTLAGTATTVTWPMTEASTYAPKIGINKWNVIQLMFTRGSDGYGSLAAWHAIAGEEPKLIGRASPRSIFWGSDADALISHKWFQFMNQASNRAANPSRPEVDELFGEYITSQNPIAFPGGFIPYDPFNGAT